MLLKTVKSPIQCLSAPNVILPTPLKKGVGMHIKMKHRISQPDGIDNSFVGDSEEDDTVNLVLGGIFCIPLKHSGILQSHSP